jgi:myo-inositol-1(or 4)-monophosphatase
VFTKTSIQLDPKYAKGKSFVIQAKNNSVKNRYIQSATLNGKPIHVTGETTLQQSMLATGFSYNLNDRALQYDMWAEMNTRARGVRRDGAAALNLCWVAAGRLDGFWERPVQAWDMGAGVILVREAGGMVTRLEDEGFDLYSPQALAANPVLHAEIQAVLKSIIAVHQAPAS